VPLSTAQECVDRTNLQATITNESREAAPRPRHHGVFRTRTHIRASSLPKMSAGIRNPCASINQPARALALGTDRPAHAGQRNNHYGCPTIRKAGPRDPVVKAKACAPSTAAWLKRGAAEGGRSPAPPMAAEARRRRWQATAVACRPKRRRGAM
jgi:hypothetical protein